MASLNARVLLLVAAAGLSAQAANLGRSQLGIVGSTFSTARRNYNWPYDEVTECGHNIYATLQSIADRPLVAQKKLLAWGGCRYSDGYPRIEGILNQWPQLGMECIPINPDYPPPWSTIEDWKPWFFIWRLENGWHGGVFIPELPGEYGARNDLHGTDGIFNFLDMIKERQSSKNGILDCLLFRFPNDKLNNCNSVKYSWGWDSTMKWFEIKHNIHCCWKEKLPGEAPWSSNPSPYACLDWSESSGITWDTLIGQRANLVGCTSVVLDCPQ